MAEQSNVNDADQEEFSPFWLRQAFPDPQGILSSAHNAIEASAATGFIALDANVLLLPYKLDGVTLSDVISVYKKVSEKKRLVIPAQAVREFAKHRSEHVGNLVKYLRDEASMTGPTLKKKVGALLDNSQYSQAVNIADEIKTQVKKLRTILFEITDGISERVGEDPVSIAYRNVFMDAVSDDPPNCQNEEAFKKILDERYAVKRPPGYKDKNKSDFGGGDLMIWQTILHEGENRKSDCIFVTADEKSDWYVQSGGPFQPRLELIEEYRCATGKSVHIIPLSKLLKLFEASEEVLEDVRKAEDALAEISVMKQDLLRAKFDDIAYYEQKISNIESHLQHINNKFQQRNHLPVHSDTEQAREFWDLGLEREKLTRRLHELKAERFNMVADLERLTKQDARK